MTTLCLKPADYVRQPWKNGRGVTTELWRLEHYGALLVRLSRATVTEDGPFSVFPGLERNLTVLSGPGFRLTGEGIGLRCNPLRPVAFPGHVRVTATETQGQPSEDFNVMTAGFLHRPEVRIIRYAHLPKGGLVALYTLGAGRIGGTEQGPDALFLTEQAVDINVDAGVIAVRVHGVRMPPLTPVASTVLPMVGIRS